MLDRSGRSRGHDMVLGPLDTRFMVCSFAVCGEVGVGGWRLGGLCSGYSPDRPKEKISQGPVATCSCALTGLAMNLLYTLTPCQGSSGRLTMGHGRRMILDRRCCIPVGRVLQTLGRAVTCLAPPSFLIWSSLIVDDGNCGVSTLSLPLLPHLSRRFRSDWGRAGAAGRASLEFSGAILPSSQAAQAHRVTPAPTQRPFHPTTTIHPSIRLPTHSEIYHRSSMTTVHSLTGKLRKTCQKPNPHALINS